MKNGYSSSGRSGRSYVLKLIHEAHKLGALQGSDNQMVSLLEAATLEPQDPVICELVNEALQPFRTREILEPDPLRPYPGPESGLHIGEIEVGTIRETELPWRL